MQLQLQRTQSHRRRTIEIPHTMEAAAIDHFGPPEVLTLHVLPVPAVDAGEVLIALDTAGVGPWDADIREGWYPSGTPHFPLVRAGRGWSRHRRCGRVTSAPAEGWRQGVLLQLG